MAQRKAFEIGGETIAPGTRKTVNLALPNQSLYTPMSMPLHVVHGKSDGPVLFVCASIHGDEINGVEIIRELIRRRRFRGLRGTIIFIPIVNVYGFMTHSRYLPDGRDLNRSFPGSTHGSLAARLANRFTQDILARCTHGIDLHTAGGHRINHPHIRANMDDAETRDLAMAFGTPVVINANIRDGSLRQVAADMGIKMLLYEAGAPLRFEPFPIRVGTRGVINVMRKLGMLKTARRKPPHSPTVARTSSWVRAPVSGILRTEVTLGQKVGRGAELGLISDPLGSNATPIDIEFDGIVIGRTQLPVVNEGDALFHIAKFSDAAEVEQAVEAFHLQHLEGLGPQDYAVPPSDT